MASVTQFCSVIAGEIVRDGITANCVFTFEILNHFGTSRGLQFHVVLPSSDRLGPAHMLFLAIAMRHILRVDLTMEPDGSVRFVPRYEDLLPTFQRSLVDHGDYSSP